MKKIQLTIKTLAALLVAGAAFTACSSEDVAAEQPVNAPGTYTLTVNATKGSSANTRALSLSGNTLTATWATTENVYVKKVSTWVTGSLQPQANGATATLSGTLSDVTIAADDELTLQFPKSGDISYSGQVGTLEDIAANFDYATANVTVASVTDGKITVSGTTNFENQQAIIKFTLKDSEGNSISATQLVVNDGTTDYTITPASATSEIFAAIPGVSEKTITLTATVGEDTYTYQKSGVTFTNGSYYAIGVKMTHIVDLSKLTAAYTAQDGDVLTGTLGTNVQISIADGATVTLSGASINGGIDLAYKWAGLTCAGNATIILADGSENTVKGFFENYPGIFVPEGKTLTINGQTSGTGQLTASSNGWGCGIGGGLNISCGNISITGGTVNATGGQWAAGIGSGYNSSCGNISITGGTITAKGGDNAAGIGSGYTGSSCGTIRIAATVTSVTATKGKYAPNSIGAGVEGTCGTVTIPEGENVTQN